MKNSSIFHIGFHKTGTTWFQIYYYPYVKNANFIDVIQTKDLFINKKAFDKVIINKSNLDDNKPVIYCHEELTGNIHTGGMNSYITKEMAYRIKSVCPDSKIVIFIRNQIDMIASCYNQYIQEGGTYGVDRYLYHKDFNRIWRAPLFSFDHFNYYNIINLYSSLFGDENIFIFLFEEFDKDFDKFIVKFEDKLEIKSNWRATEKLNVRYRKGIMVLARIRNLFCYNDVLYKYYFCNLPIPSLLRKSNKLLRYLNRSPVFGMEVNSEKLLGDSVVQYIKNYYKEPNNKLNQRYGVKLDQYKYPL